MTSTNFITYYIDGVRVVIDSDGGVWWPSEEAVAEIEASASPEDTAIRICETAPMRGEWRS